MFRRQTRRPRNSKAFAVADSSRRRPPQGASENKHIRLVGGFGDRSRVTLRYVSRFSLTTTVSAQQYAFAGNDCYDPDVTSTGSQPANFDDWMVMYTKFKVHGCRARVQAVGTSSASPAIVSFGARQSISTGIVEDDASRPRHEVRFVGIATNGAPQAFDMKYSTQSVLGYTVPQYEGTDTLNGTSSASPTKLWYWCVRQSSFDDSTSVTVRYVITLDYDVEFFERLDQTLDLSAKIAAVSAQLGALRKRAAAAASKGQEEKVERKELPTGAVPLVRQPHSALALEPEYELVQLARRKQ